MEENKQENKTIIEKLARKKTQNFTVIVSKDNEKERSPKKFSLFAPFVENLLVQQQTEQKSRASGSFLTVGPNLVKFKKKQVKKHNVEEILKNASNESETMDERLKTYGFVLNNLGQGESFGEKALLGEASRRTATVVASTDVELLVLKKKNFLEITQKFNLEKERKKKFLLKVLPYLNIIRSINTLENLFYCFKEENLILGFAVTEEDQIDPEEKIFFLVEGRCKIERKFYETCKGLTQVTNCQIAEVTSESMIGEEILFEEHSQYKYTVTVKFPKTQNLVIKKLGNIQLRLFLLCEQSKSDDEVSEGDSSISLE